MDLRSLPEDVITRILSYNHGNTSKIFSETQLPHVNVSQYTKEALAFANSQANAELLCKTLQSRLILRKNTFSSQALFDTLAPHLEELIVDGFSDDFTFRTAAQCENLRRLELNEFPEEFDWSTLPRGLTEVHVTVHSKGQMDVIENALQKLHVRELGIRYGSPIYYNSTKLHKEVKLACCKLANSNKQLQKLSIRKLDQKKHFTWDIVKHFRAVQHIVINERPTKKALRMLLSKQSVTFKTPEMALASSLGEKVTAVDLRHTCCSNSLKAEDIAKLSACKTLKVLRARVLAGAETQLHELPAGIKELELWFTPGFKLQAGHPQHSIESSVSITPGSIRKFLSGAHLLSGLCIYGAEVDKTEIKEVLAVLGERLLKFGVTVDTQDSSLAFTEEILDLIAQRNRSLKELNMHCEIFEEWEGLGVAQDLWVDQECLQRLEVCLGRFHRSVPGAQILYLVSLLRRLVRARI